MTIQFQFDIKYWHQTPDTLKEAINFVLRLLCFVETPQIVFTVILLTLINSFAPKSLSLSLEDFRVETLLIARQNETSQLS